MIRVNTRLYVDSTKIEIFKAIAFEMIDKTRAEDGCIAYELFKDNNFSLNPEATIDKSVTIFSFNETWENQELMEAHIGAPHMMELIPQVIATLTKEIDVIFMDLIK